MDKVKFGDIISIKLAKDDFYLSAPGFIQNDLQLKKVISIEEEDINNSLFKIIPPLSFPVLQ